MQHHYKTFKRRSLPQICHSDGGPVGSKERAPNLYGIPRQSGARPKAMYIVLDVARNRPAGWLVTVRLVRLDSILVGRC